MARILSLAVAAVLVTSSFAQIHQFLRRADDSEVIDPDDCRGEGWENDLVARFTGIFFGDFYTGGSQDILGPLAVKGNFHAPNYIVNANHGTLCEETDSFNSYGLVVQGITDTFNTHVHGSGFLNMGGTIEEVMELDVGCYITDQEGTGLFNFEEIEDLLLTTSQEFAGFNPTLILGEDNMLTELRSELANYEVLTFHTCDSSKCSSNPNSESYPDKLFFAEPNWNGVQGPVQIDKDKTYIINVPVTNGATFEFDTNNPALGFDPCKLIWNFYPVDDDGNYLPDGEFTLIRRTQNQLGGFTLAPRGHIVDGSVGNFAGNIVGLDYTWENLNSGVEIHDYGSAGGDCDQYLGCLPVHETSSLSMTKSTSINTSTTSRSRTKTWTTTQTLTISNSDIVTYDSSNFPETSSSSASGPITITETSDCTDSLTTTTTTDTTETSVLSITVTTRSRTTVPVTTTTTESIDTSFTTISGSTETETETQTETQVATVTNTNANVETVTSSGSDVTTSSTTTVTEAIVTKTTSTICTDTTNTIYSDCGTVEICSSVTYSEDEHDKDHWHTKDHDKDYDKDHWHKDEDEDDEDDDDDDEDEN